MTDEAKRIIEIFRYCPSGDCEGCYKHNGCIDEMDDAADLIEQLVAKCERLTAYVEERDKDIEVLHDICNELRTELEAAKHDIGVSCMCEVCSHDTGRSPECEPCVFDWVGVRKENGGAESEHD